MSAFIWTFKRWMTLLHRYFGVGLCLLCAMWFATGMVLMYAPLPEFRPDLQLARARPLRCAHCALALGAALTAMPGRDSGAPVRLGMFLDRPVWRYLGTDQRWHMVDAADGSPLSAIDGAQATGIAAEYAGLASSVEADSTTIIAPDQWTLEGVLRHQLPLHLIKFGDARGTNVYVSAYGGEATLSTTRRERALSWVGGVPHFLYPRVLRSRLKAWRATVIGLAALGLFLTLTGLTIGIWNLRVRRRLDREGVALPLSPYRVPWMRWHHYLGSLFGVVAFSWLLSGMLSIDPLDWSPGDGPTEEEELAFAGGAVESVRFIVSPAEAAQRLAHEFGVRELRPIMVGGRAFWIGTDSASRSRALAADSAGAPVLESIPAAILNDGVRSLLPGRRLASVVQLREFDDFYHVPPYYRVARPRPLPILVVRADDAEHTAYYIDPRLGAIVLREGSRSRVERWLYTGLHDLDFRALASRRPLWDIVVLVLALGGLSLATTGAVIGWRWLMRAKAKRVLRPR